ncbi:MAG: BspA family leucine-rich repeat surface protein [Bacteroides sp.]
MRGKSQILCTVLLLLLAQLGWAGDFKIKVDGESVSLGIVPKKYPFSVKDNAGKEIATIYAFGQKFKAPSDGIVAVSGSNIYGFAKNPDSKNITEVLDWGGVKWKTLEYAFTGSNISNITAGTPNLSECWSLEGTFQDCESFNGDLKAWDVKHVRNMRNTFKNAKAFSSDISGWNVQAVSDMSGMFMNATAFATDLTKWGDRVQNVASMENTFQGATAFNYNLGLWKLKGVKKIGIGNSGISGENYSHALMFWNAMGMEDVALDATGLYYSDVAVAAHKALEAKKWTIRGDYTDVVAAPNAKPFILHIIANKNATVTVPVLGRDMKISYRNTAKSLEGGVKDGITATQESEMYTFNATSGQVYEVIVEAKGVVAFKGNKVDMPFSVEQWGDVAWKTMSHMFDGATVSFSKRAGKPNMELVEDCSFMFKDCKGFNGDLSAWDMSKVKDMSHMFDGCEIFNSPLNKWNVSSVKSMNSMFKGCEKFNQLLNSWTVASVEDFESMFEGCKEYNKPMIGWTTTSVRNMQAMFKGCEKFNQPLPTWNTEKVQNMSEMFYGCKKYNQPLASWKVAYVTSFANTFNGAKAFDQALGAWELRRVRALDLSSTALSSENYTASLIDWAKQGDICTDFQLSVKENFEYKKEAIDARKSLETAKKWVFSKDKAEKVEEPKLTMVRFKDPAFYVYKGKGTEYVCEAFGKIKEFVGEANFKYEVKSNFTKEDEEKNLSISHKVEGGAIKVTITPNEEVEGEIFLTVLRREGEYTRQTISFKFKAIEDKLKDIHFTPDMSVVYLRHGEEYDLPVQVSSSLKDYQRVPALNLENDTKENLDKLVQAVNYDEKDKIKLHLKGFAQGEYTVRMASAYDPAVKATTFKVVVIPALTKFQILGDQEIMMRMGEPDYHIALDMVSDSELSKQVEWSCEPDNVATVYQNGEVKPLQVGFATITLKTFTYPQITKTLKLTVLPADAKHTFTLTVKDKDSNPVPVSCNKTPENVVPGGTSLVEITTPDIELKDGNLELSDDDKASGAEVTTIVPNKLYLVRMGTKDIVLEGTKLEAKEYTLDVSFDKTDVSVEKYIIGGSTYTMSDATQAANAAEALKKLGKSASVSVALKNDSSYPVLFETTNCDVEMAGSMYVVKMDGKNAKVLFRVLKNDVTYTFTTEATPEAGKPAIKLLAKVEDSNHADQKLDKLMEGDVVTVMVVEPTHAAYTFSVTGGAEVTTVVENKEYKIRMGNADAKFTLAYDKTQATYQIDVVDNTQMGFTSNPASLSGLEAGTEVTITVNNSANKTLAVDVEGVAHMEQEGNVFKVKVGYQDGVVVINAVNNLKPNTTPNQKPEDNGGDNGGGNGGDNGGGNGGNGGDNGGGNGGNNGGGTLVEDAVLANVLVAPNPFTSFLMVNAALEGRYELLNVQGMVLRAGELSGAETRVETLDLNAGLYLLRVSIANGASKTFKVVKR